VEVRGKQDKIKQNKLKVMKVKWKVQGEGKMWNKEREIRVSNIRSE
jgi:hypothetical protein